MDPQELTSGVLALLLVGCCCPDACSAHHPLAEDYPSVYDPTSSFTYVSVSTPFYYYYMYAPAYKVPFLEDNFSGSPDTNRELYFPSDSEAFSLYPPPRRTFLDTNADFESRFYPSEMKTVDIPYTSVPKFPFPNFQEPRPGSHSYAPQFKNKPPSWFFESNLPNYGAIGDSPNIIRGEHKSTNIEGQRYYPLNRTQYATPLFETYTPTQSSFVNQNPISTLFPNVVEDRTAPPSTSFKTNPCTLFKKPHALTPLLSQTPNYKPLRIPTLFSSVPQNIIRNDERTTTIPKTIFEERPYIPDKAHTVSPLFGIDTATYENIRPTNQNLFSPVSPNIIRNDERRTTIPKTIFEGKPYTSSEKAHTVSPLSGLYASTYDRAKTILPFLPSGSQNIIRGEANPSTSFPTNNPLRENYSPTPPEDTFSPSLSPPTYIAPDSSNIIRAQITDQNSSPLQEVSDTTFYPASTPNVIPSSDGDRGLTLSDPDATVTDFLSSEVTVQPPDPSSLTNVVFEAPGHHYPQRR